MERDTLAAAAAKRDKTETVVVVIKASGLLSMLAMLDGVGWGCNGVGRMEEGVEEQLEIVWAEESG